ncbi:hypothetical protein [Streptosporangium sp. NPDC002721]|uniref:hypothetical protein n=1 Tax=Streptosporangium sp. NPDC002721 TaxID=3366188 RepID=UPI0036CE590D
MSRQTSFTLMLLLSFSVIVPGSAGYLSVKMEAIGQAHRELLTLESRIRAERLAARIRKLERTSRDRRLQPIISSGREACDPSARSRDGQGTRSSDPATVVPVPVASAERARERRPHARRHVERHVAHGQNTRRWDARGPDTWGPDVGGPRPSWQDAPEPGVQGLTAQGPLEAGTTGDAAPVERWSQLERRGRPHGEGEAREEHTFTLPDATGTGSAPEDIDASRVQDLPAGPPLTETGAKTETRADFGPPQVRTRAN